MTARCRLVFQILSLAFLTMLMPLFQNCVAQRPTVEYKEFASTGYYHSGVEMTCNSCHSASRPSGVTGFLSVNTNTTFNFRTHGVNNVNNDCSSCHESSKMNVGTRKPLDWASGHFNHASAVTCTECHNAPATIAPNNQPHPTSTATEQCTSCHTQALATMQSKSPADYQSLTSSLWKGTDPGLVFGTNSTRSINVYNPTYNALSAATNPGIFSSWTGKSQTIIMFMDHHSSSIPASMKSTSGLDCLSCHSADPTGFTGGVFHISVANASQNQPASCIDCHGVNLSAGSAGTTLPVKGTGSSAFVGAGPKVNATTALFNHDSGFGKADCVSCHAQTNWASANWTSGKFHSAVAVQPTTCTECHAPARPAGTVTDSLTSISMNHSQNGMGECASCHQASMTGVSKFTTWRGGVGTPVGPSGGTNTVTPLATILTMSGGAVTGRTASATLSLPLLMDHATVSGMSCNTCHLGTGYAGAKFHANATVASTTTCISCHSNSGTAAPGNILGWDPVNLKTKPADHAHTSLVNSDCRSCHATPTAAVKGINFKDGSFHAKLATQPTTCAACHAVKLVDNKFPNGVDHTSYMSKDCTSCHSFPGTGGTAAAPNWLGATDGANHTATASCIRCHAFSGASNAYTFKSASATDARTTVLPAVTFNYPATGTAMVIGAYAHTSGTAATYDCITCHVNVPSASGVTVAVNATHLPTATGALRTFWKGSTSWYHANVFKGTGTDSAIGAQLGTTNSCSGCHTFNPANTPKGLAPKKNPGTDMHTYTAAKSGQCGVCHAISAGVNSWAASYAGATFAHKFKNKTGFTSCTACHPSGW